MTRGTQASFRGGLHRRAPGQESDCLGTNLRQGFDTTRCLAPRFAHHESRWAPSQVGWRRYPRQESKGRSR